MHRSKVGLGGEDTELRRGKYSILLSRSGFPISRIAPIIYIGWSDSFQNPGSRFHGRGLASTFSMLMNAPLHEFPWEERVGICAMSSLLIMSCCFMWMENDWHLSFFSIHTVGPIALLTLVVKLGTFVSKEERIFFKVFNLQWACLDPMELKEYFGMPLNWF